MNFIINLEVAEEGFIKDKWDQLNAWADKKNTEKEARYKKPVTPGDSVRNRIIKDFSNITAAMEYLIAHPEEEDLETRYTVMVSGVKYPVSFHKGVITEEYKASIIKAFSNLPSNLPRIRKEAAKAFSSPYMFDDIDLTGKPKPTPLPSQEIAKVIPDILVGKNKDGKVFLRYYFYIDDFLDPVYDSDRMIGIDCLEGKWDNNSTWTTID